MRCVEVDEKVMEKGSGIEAAWLVQQNEPPYEGRLRSLLVRYALRNLFEIFDGVRRKFRRENFPAYRLE